MTARGAGSKEVALFFLGDVRVASLQIYVRRSQQAGCALLQEYLILRASSSYRSGKRSESARSSPPPSLLFLSLKGSSVLSQILIQIPWL